MVKLLQAQAAWSNLTRTDRAIEVNQRYETMHMKPMWRGITMMIIGTRVPVGHMLCCGVVALFYS